MRVSIAQKKMKKINLLMGLVLTVFCLNSCMVTKTTFGSYKQEKGQVYTYSQSRQGYLFWGLLPVGKCDVKTPENESCQVRTKFRFVDALVSTITGGIYSMQTIQVMKKKPANDQSAFAKGDQVDYLYAGKYSKGTIDSIVDEETCIVKNEQGKLKKVKLENLAK